MAKVQEMRVVKSLIQKGLFKKEARKNKNNKGSTSNLYTLLNPKPKNKNNNGKIEGVSDRYPNNTNIKKTNLNNVNRAGSEEVVENSESEIRENTVENEEDVNDIRRKIKESLKEKGKCNFTEPKDPRKENKLSETQTDPKGKYFKNRRVEEYPRINRFRSRRKELLAKEIAEELNDNHSLGAFRAVVDKISEQKIRIFLSIIKDTYLTGKIKESRGAMFISLAKTYAGKNNINLNFR